MPPGDWVVAPREGAPVRFNPTPFQVPLKPDVSEDLVIEIMAVP